MGDRGRSSSSWISRKAQRGCRIGAGLLKRTSGKTTLRCMLCTARWLRVVRSECGQYLQSGVDFDRSRSSQQLWIWFCRERGSC
eukprot:6199266-Pleurochrysis_carterae.AAC.5